MKKLTSYNRAAGYLNRIFDLLNEEYFENELTRPVITIQSTPRAYGHFSLRDDTWVSVTGNSHEINIGAGTLARPIEDVVTTMIHEMIHYWCYIHGIKDCSRGGTYHNKRFLKACLERDLVVTHSDKYGWSHTAPADGLLEFVLKNDLTDILLSRNEFSSSFGVGLGAGSNNGSGSITPVRTSSSRKYACPCCGMSIRATKAVRVACIECGNIEMQLQTPL